MSVTTAGVGWVLVDATKPDGCPLDDDEFAIDDLDALIPRCGTAVRGAATIAATSGHRIAAIGICWSAELDGRSTELLAAVRALGCTDVRPIPQVRPVSAAGSRAGATVGVDLDALLAGLFDDDADPDAADATAAVTEAVPCGAAVGETPAYAAARLVLSDAVPARSVPVPRPRRQWSLPPVGARVLTLRRAAAVTAVIALFAVGSQFGGSETPDAATLANRATVSTPQTSPIVPAQPPAVQPLAAPPAPAPQAAPVAQWTPPAEPVAPAAPVAQWTPPAEPVAVQTVAPEPVAHVPDAVPAAPGVDPAVPAGIPAVPADVPVPPGADPVIAAPAPAPPPAPFAAFAPPPLIPPAAPLAAPVEPAPLPPPPAPIFGALP
jgi:hypothetical protein